MVSHHRLSDIRPRPDGPDLGPEEVKERHMESKSRHLPQLLSSTKHPNSTPNLFNYEIGKYSYHRLYKRIKV